MGVKDGLMEFHVGDVDGELEVKAEGELEGEEEGDIDRLERSGTISERGERVGVEVTGCDDGPIDGWQVGTDVFASLCTKE